MALSSTNLEGRRFGRLVVTKLAGKRWRSPLWSCLCDCGTRRLVVGPSLVHGKTRSCGCLHREAIGQRAMTHGFAVRRIKIREYNIWSCAKSRCHNPRHRDYRNYGGRGITMCARWRHSFVLFLADMGRCPRGLSLERTNNNKGYSPSNCVWATRKEQGNNQRRSAIIRFRGVSRTRTQWAEHLGMDISCLRGRLRLGWSIKKTLTTP